MEDSLEIDNRAPATIRVIVSPGRAVTTGLPFKVVQVVTAGVTKSVRVPVENPGKMQFSEGEEVELPAAEARRLMALGFCFLPADRPGFSRPLGITADAQPMVERASPDGPTTMQAEDDPDSGMGRPIGITQSEPRASART